MLRGQQTLVFSKERRGIGTHHITLGTAPIGGHRATVLASHLPAEPFPAGEGCQGDLRPPGVSQTPRSSLTAIPSPPGPALPGSSLQFFFICVTICFQSLFQALREQDGVHGVHQCILSTWHICQKNE